MLHLLFVNNTVFSLSCAFKTWHSASGALLYGVKGGVIYFQMWYIFFLLLYRVVCTFLAYVLEYDCKRCNDSGQPSKSCKVWLCRCACDCGCVCVNDCASTHSGFGHLMSCRLISPCGAQMACDYAQLSRDYWAAEAEREALRVKIHSSSLQKIRWKYELHGSRTTKATATMLSLHQRRLLHRDTEPFNCKSLPSS